MTLIGRYVAYLNKSPILSIYGLSILAALQSKPHVYMGTVPARNKTLRRAAHLRAKASRKRNRGAYSGR